MRIPPNASKEVQDAFRDLHLRIDKVIGPAHADNADLKGKRFTNAGDAEADTDLVTLKQVNALIDEALGIAADTSSTSTGSGSTSGGGGVEGGTDDGLGAQGCEQAGSDGHVTGPLTAVLAGQIVCGTGNEFASLKAATSDQATRDANSVQLIQRMIWHLQQAGFTAGRQQNPSGAISNNKLTVQVEGVFRAYDVLVAANDFTQPMGTGMSQVFPASYVADSGIAD